MMAWSRTVLSIGGFALAVAALVQAADLMAENDAPLLLAELSPPKLPAIATRELAPIEGFAAIAEHPLFAPSRRPAPPAPGTETVAGAPANTVPLSAVLIGVLLSPRRHAAVVRLADGKNKTLAEGDSIDGWTLERVLPDRASFQSGETRMELLFPLHQASAAAASAAPTSRFAPARR
jgi:hypothetical protein